MGKSHVACGLAPSIAHYHRVRVNRRRLRSLQIERRRMTKERHNLRPRLRVVLYQGTQHQR